MYRFLEDWSSGVSNSEKQAKKGQYILTKYDFCGSIATSSITSPGGDYEELDQDLRTHRERDDLRRNVLQRGRYEADRHARGNESARAACPDPRTPVRHQPVNTSTMWKEKKPTPKPNAGL